MSYTLRQFANVMARRIAGTGGTQPYFTSDPYIAAGLLRVGVDHQASLGAWVGASGFTYDIRGNDQTVLAGPFSSTTTDVTIRPTASMENRTIKLRVLGFSGAGVSTAAMSVPAGPVQSAAVVAPGIIPTITIGAVTASTAPMTWTLPVTGDAPTDYEWRFKRTADATYTTVVDGVSIVRALTLMALDPITPYTVQGRATNAGGPGLWKTATFTTLAATATGQMIKQINIQEGSYYNLANWCINLAMARNVTTAQWEDDGTLKALANGATVANNYIVHDGPAAYRHKPGNYTLRVRAGLQVTISASVGVGIGPVTGTARQKSFEWTGQGNHPVWIDIKNVSGATLPAGTDPELFFGLTAELPNWDAGKVLPAHILPHFQAVDCIRLLGDMFTNNSPWTSASQIPQLGTINNRVPLGDWQAWGCTPPEQMAKAAMESGAEPWCPTYNQFGYADNVAWDTRFAAVYTAGRLRKEYCNENWNYGFVQHQARIAAKGQADGLSCRDYIGLPVPPGTETWHDWLCAGWAQGSLDTWRAAEQVYGRERVIRVIASQAGDSQGWNGVLFYRDPLTGQKVGDMMDELAIAPYTGTISPRPSIRAVHGLPTGAGAMDYPAQVRRKDYELGNARWTTAFAAAIDEVVLYVQAWRAVLDANGWASKRLVCYEGGFHEFYLLPEMNQSSGEAQDGAVGCTANVANQSLQISSSTTFAKEFADGDEIGWSYVGANGYANAFPDGSNSSWVRSGVYCKLVGGEMQLYTSPTVQNASTRVALSARVWPDGANAGQPIPFGIWNATRMTGYIQSLRAFIASPAGVATRQAANTALMAAGLDAHSWFTSIGWVEDISKAPSVWGLSGEWPPNVSDMTDTNKYCALKWFDELPKGITA